jgi:L-histidine N-alpha-methyltransferase
LVQGTAGASPARRRPDADKNDFARAVLLGLSEAPRWLPCQYLYDARGSELFERITALPEYYPTRTEAGILETAAPEIASSTGPITMIELGSGSSVKTEVLLSAYTQAAGAFTYVPVDVSGAALRGAQQRIEAAHPEVRVAPIEGTYQDAFPKFRQHSPSLVVFLGSTLGNFDQGQAAAFWRHVSDGLAPGDFFLLGVDVVKDPVVIEAAYNDAAGITAAFTNNLFVRMNRELDAGLDPSAIAHEAHYHADWQRVEIYARFERTQTVRVAPLGQSVVVPAGARILVEVSRKFVVDDLRRYLSAFDLTTRRVFTDPQEWFAVMLLQREGER